MTSNIMLLANQLTVVIGFWTFSSFFKHDYECWNGNADKATGSHAMCVVGYDDNKFGGAFLVMNSWGTGWGKGGLEAPPLTGMKQNQAE